MKNILITVIMSFMLYTGFTQTNNAYQARLDSMSTIVINYLQAKQADSIYALGGENFKSHITAADFKSVSENQVFPLNDFKHVTFVSTSNGINKYKVAGTPDLQLLISLDADNKLETLLIQTFEQ